MSFVLIKSRVLIADVFFEEVLIKVKKICLKGFIT